MEPAPMNAR